MAMDKMWRENNTRLENIEQKLESIESKLSGPEKSPPVTKEQLMEIKGVGESTAESILELLGNS